MPSVFGAGHRAELQCVDGAASLHYVIRSKIRYGSIISVASSNPNAVEPTLPSSRPTADESGSGGQQQQGGGGQAASKRSSWSTMLDEGETPLTVATRCRGVGDAVVTVSLSMQTPAAEVTRELVLLETVCCTRESVEAAQQVQDHGDASGCIAMCSHRGSCVKGVCLCAFGFHGASCEKTCPGGHEAPCSLRGRCDAKSGKCACIPGYCEPPLPSPLTPLRHLYRGFTKRHQTLNSRPQPPYSRRAGLLERVPWWRRAALQRPWPLRT